MRARRRAVIAVFCAAVVSAPAKAQDAKPAAAKAPVRLRFDWGTRCAVTVTETALKNDHTMRARYRVELSPSTDGRELRVRMADWEFLELDGRDLTRPEMRAEMESALAAVGTVPVLRVSHEGDFLGSIGVEEMVDAFLSAMKMRNPAAPVDDVRAKMLSPTWRRILEARMGDDWNRWVGAWNGLEMAPNTTEDHALEVPVGGHKLAMPLRYLHLGMVPGAAEGRRIRLRQESSVAGKDLMPVIATMIPDLPAQMEKEDGPLVGGERTVVLEAETDPVTLRPTRASSDMRIRLVSASGKEHTRRDSKESVFDWVGAKGCDNR